MAETVRVAPGGVAQRSDDAEVRHRRVGLEVLPAVPAEVPVGTSVSFKVRVACGDAD